MDILTVRVNIGILAVAGWWDGLDDGNVADGDDDGTKKKRKDSILSAQCKNRSIDGEKPSIDT